MDIFFMAIGLSMDAFSLALAYGTLGKKILNFKLALIVGIFHFFMPLLGLKLGNLLNINNDFIIFLILLFVGIQMIYETFKNKDLNCNFNLKGMILFALAVSLDSFSIGVGLKVITKEIIFAPIIFCLFSFSFTYLGLILGNKINELIGKFSTIFGGILLILIGIYYIL